MKNCEHHERHVSAWLDDELDRAEQIELFDHLVRCDSCRKFYVEARALDGLVSMIGNRSSGQKPPADAWQKIARATGAPRRPGVPAWALRAAAAIVLAVGLGVVFWSGQESGLGEPAQVEVVIGEDAASMTEGRFVELAKEVLRADRQYHEAMLSIMEQVVRDTETMEASSEEVIRQPEDGEAAEVELPGHLPA